MLSHSLSPEAPVLARVELHLLVGDDLFGVAFLDLDEAKAMAHQLSASGRAVDIFEKASGRVVYRCAAGA
ncbi:MAG TPA: hypothetical protein PLY97_09985 [Acidocella sp.]|nr:hypothetical protein [Acidocella sp.]